MEPILLSPKNQEHRLKILKKLKEIPLSQRFYDPAALVYEIKMFLLDQLSAAASDGDIELVNYLLKTKEFDNPKIHSRKDQLFMLIANENIEMIKYLIFDYKIEETDYIKEFLINSKKVEIQIMFKNRTLNENLQNSLTNKDSIKKKKI